MFPHKLTLKEKILRLLKDEQGNGRNLKSKYVDAKKNGYYAKIDKNRSITDIFGDSGNITAIPNIKLKSHINLLRDEAAIIALIASRLAGTIFKDFLRVPENYLTRLSDGTPITLSKLIPNEEKFDEFLSKKNVILDKKPTGPESWQNQRLTRKSLNLSLDEANILGKLYYIALLLAHWDILNNINLTNSGTVIIKDKLMPCIVDWGNCLSVGFMGKSQDDNAFKGFDPSRKDADLLMGYRHAIPFDIIPYLRLPRQLVMDLFNLTSDDKISQSMLEGFIEAHMVAKQNIYEGVITDVVEKTFQEAVSQTDQASFRGVLTKSMFFKTNKQPPELESILKGRLVSLEQVIGNIQRGRTMDEIADKQLRTIKESQYIRRPRL